MNSPVRLLARAVPITLLSGCAATKATVNIVAADQAVARATEQEAAELAPYEYTLALRYLEKSKEEAGYADYRASVELSEAAAKWADQAIIVIQKGAGRGRSIEDAGEELSDDPSKMRPPPEPMDDPTAPLPPPPPGDILEDEEPPELR